LQPRLVRTPAIDRALIDRQPHLRGAGRSHRSLSLIKAQAGIIPFEATMGNDASRLILQIGDKLLILHFQYGSLGKNGPPMPHQLRIGATVAAEFGKIIGVLVADSEMLRKA
jgi:hypothetical protein